jgi:hypothetical protein
LRDSASAAGEDDGEAVGNLYEGLGRQDELRSERTSDEHDVAHHGEDHPPAQPRLEALSLLDHAVDGFVHRFSSPGSV